MITYFVCPYVVYESLLLTPPFNLPKMSKVPNLDSEVNILKTKAAAKKGLNVTPAETETIWPKPEFVSSNFRYESRPKIRKYGRRVRKLTIGEEHDD